MVEDSNVKTLGRVFVIVFIIIFLIIILSLINYVFSVSSHDYVIPSTTPIPVNERYKELSDGDKLKYNEQIIDDKLIYLLNNSISDSMDYYNINLIQSEKVKFKYIYAYSYFIDNKDSLSYSDIINYSNRLFNVNISKNNFSEYLIDDNYKYDINSNIPSFCLKAKSVKESDNDIIYIYDIIDYNEGICRANYLDYDNNIVKKVLTLRMLKNGENKYIDSIILNEKED